MKQIKIITLTLIAAWISPLHLVTAQTEKAERVYNQGIDFYNKSDYNKAGEYFLKAFNTEKQKVEQWASFNLGNANFKNAEKMQDKQPEEALKSYKNALKFFQRAIELNPQDKDAKYNYELTAKKIQQQKQKQKSQKQKQQQKRQKNKNQQGQSSNPQPDKQNGRDKQKQQQSQQQQKKQQQAQQQQEQTSQGSAARQEQSKPREMTKEEAQMLLENFKRSEDGPTELRLLNQQQNKEQAADKYW